MPGFNRQLWRAAGHLHACLRPPDTELRHPQQIQDSTTVIPRLTQQLKSVEARHWHTASQYVKRQLQAQLLEFQRQVTEMLDALSARRRVPHGLTQKELYAELVALATEFDECDIDLRAGTLSVVTEAIVLEEVELGPFRIVLPWGARLPGQTQPYTVVALEPRYPHSSSQITHPHVVRDCLCEGEAKPALRQALQEGRLNDFFQIINRVLHNYNGHSPYAALDEWEGIECHSCGTHISRDSDYCGICEASVCDDCGTCCQFCETSACDGCLQICSQCDDRCCPACLKSCTDCGQPVCPQCLTNNNLCQECSDETQSDPDQPTPTTTTDRTNSSSTVQSPGLGQVAVPA